MDKREEARAKAQKYGQDHVLAALDTLGPAEQEALLDQVLEADMEIFSASLAGGAAGRGRLAPLAAMELDHIRKHKSYYRDKGLAVLAQGRVGALLLAGGMGTRLGSDAPKGMYNVGIGRNLYIFECLIQNLLDVVRDSGSWIHLFVMTSEKNHQATVDFLEEKGFFGYKREFVHFFRQEMALATDFEGKILMEEPGRMCSSPNGNGGWFRSLEKAGLLELAKAEGIEWLNVFAVDNVLQKIADPVFVGATLVSGCQVGAKVVAKNAPDEKVGVICLEDGRPSIVEYYELTPELMEAKDASGKPAYHFGVILNYLFSIEALEALEGGGCPSMWWRRR